MAMRLFHWLLFCTLFLTSWSLKRSPISITLDATTWTDSVIEVTDESFQRLLDQSSSNNLLVLVQFYADWCIPCRRMLTTLSELSNKYFGEVLFAKLDTDKHIETSNAQKIKILPTLVVFSKDGTIFRSEGLQSKSSLQSTLDTILLEKRVANRPSNTLFRSTPINNLASSP